jgi:ABC-type oligopeptide transport system substrate-binding subunit
MEFRRMRSRVLLITALASATFLSACNRNSQPAQPQPAERTPPAFAPAPPPAAPQPPQIPPGTEVSLASVNSVMLNRPQDAPGSLIIDVSGVAPSAGWTNPRLVEDAEANSDASVKTYKFVATSPAKEQQDHQQQAIEAELRVDALPPEVKLIRVISASNEISAPITE